MVSSRTISNGILRAVGIVLAAALAIFLLYQIRLVFVYLFVALITSMIAMPIINFLTKKFKFPNTLAVLTTLAILILILLGFITLFVPLIITQSQNLSLLDTHALEQKTLSLFGSLNSYLAGYGVDLQKVINDANITSKLNFNFIPNLINSILSIISGIGMGVASVLFITFFLLKDKRIFTIMVKKIIRNEHEDKILNSIDKINILLSRYFLGLILQISILFVIYLSVLLIFGVQNAFIIAFITALLNVIPYIGPLIAMILVIVLTMLGFIGYSSLSDVFSTTLYVVIGYSIAQIIDNNISSPLIFSNSVKSHPLEIFLVILSSGFLFGILGMIVAIPIYTIAKVVAKEFFPNSLPVTLLTKDI